ncbi:TlpA disulfide reductase family protein [Chishuiella changwenlii]|uniref:TlpA family protein disulfide reductase n=1 Tax=Chishuiella changwenlii TaxID=1434701 RepID=UPI002FD8AB33
MKITLLLSSLFTCLILNAQKIEVKLNVDNLDNQTVLTLDPKFLIDYYENPVEDSLQNSTNHNKVTLDKSNFYYPYSFSYQAEKNHFFSSQTFYLKDRNLNLNLTKLNSEIDSDIDERKEYNIFFKDFLKEDMKYENFHGEMFLKYKLNFPKEINDSVNNWYKRNWQQEMDLLNQYISKNPKSVIAFWRIVQKYEIHKTYNYDSLLEKFDPSIKASYPYQVLKNKIIEFKMYTPGKVFPKINNLKDINNQPYKIDYSKNKYTLIDFWFHACKPCLITFPDLKNVHKEFNSKGFEIIGISVDATKNISKWKNAVKKHELPWINILDENGSFSQNNQINSYPTNFLVDQNGVIIKRNISTEELKIFLAEKL